MVISFFLCCRHLASPQSAAADGSVGEGGSVEGGGLMRERGLSTERRLFAPPTEQWLWVEELRNSHALQPIGFAGYPEDVKSGDVKRGDLRRGDVKRRDIKPTDLKMANLSRGSSVGSSVDVCIVLTVFSTASYLNQTLTSLMAQSYRGTYRIVAVDDHSEDGSAAILREWASMHRGIITLISLPFRTSGGTAAPANLAIFSCMEMGARWLTFTDGDDLTEKDFIEVLVSNGERFGAEIVLSDFDTFSRTSAELIQKAAPELKGWPMVPKNEIFNPRDNGMGSHFEGLSLLMPAPWRKLVRVDFCVAHGCNFPTGDFFYEDNVLHWHLILKASRMLVVPQVLMHHRSSRSLKISVTRLAGFFSVMHTICLDILKHEHLLTNEPVYFSYLQLYSSLRWITRAAEHGHRMDYRLRHKLAKAFESRYNGMKLRLDDARRAAAGIPTSEPKATGSYDLSIVIPCYNAADGLPTLLERLATLGNRIEVILVDGGSTDSSARIIREHVIANPTWFNISLPRSAGKEERPNPSAGSLRNLAIPLIGGRYVVFMDADDSVDGIALVEATLHAIDRNLDVLIMPYQLVFISGGDGGKPITKEFKGMDKYDAITWKYLVPGNASNVSHSALSLVNYPWNKIISSALIHDHNIFFGTTAVQNDVQFHWHAISSAQSSRIEFLPASTAPVCYHNKWVGAKRMQITKIKSKVRLEMIPAIQMTHMTLVQNASFCASSYAKLWVAHVKTMCAWAVSEKLIPEDLKGEFHRRSKRVIGCVEACQPKNSCFP